MRAWRHCLVGVGLLSLNFFTPIDSYGQVVGVDTLNVPQPVVTNVIETPMLAADPFAGQGFQICESQAIAENMKFEQLKDPQMQWLRAAQSLGGAAGGLAMGGAGAALSGAAQGAMGDNSCPGTPVFKEPGRSCSDFQDAKEKFDLDKLLAAQKRMQEGQKLVECKIAGARTAGKVMDCFSQEFDRLKDAMAASKKDLDAQTQADEEYLAKVTAEMDSQKNMMEAVGAKSDALKRAMDAVADARKKATQANKDDPSTLLGSENAWKNHKQKRADFERVIKSEKSRRASSCVKNFGAANSRLRTAMSENGSALPPFDYLISVYYQWQLGKISNNSKSPGNYERKQADLATANFKNQVNRMLGRLEAGSTQSLSIDEFLARYQRELSTSYGPAGQRLLEEIQVCSSETSAGVDADLKDAGNGLGQSRQALDEEANTISAQMGSVCESLGDAFREGVRELEGAEPAGNAVPYCNAVPIVDNKGNTSFQKQNVENQLANLKKLDANLDGMMNGRLPANRAGNPFVVRIPGYTGPEVRCKGLRDCHDISTKYKAAFELNIKKMDGAGSFKCGIPPADCQGKRAFIQTRNNQYKQFVREVGKMFAYRVNTVKLQFDRVKAMLGRNDMYFPSGRRAKDKRTVDDICPQQGTDVALCKMPGDFEDILVSTSGAPMIDGDEFDKIKSQALSKDKEYTEMSQKYADGVAELNKLKKNCTKDMKGKNELEELEGYKESIDSKLLICRKEARAAAQESRQMRTMPDAQFEDLEDQIHEICMSEGGTGSNKRVKKEKATRLECDKLKLKIQEAVETCDQVYSDEQRRAVEREYYKASTPKGPSSSAR